MALAPQLLKFSTAAPNIASYDYNSIASGINYTTFYPLVTKDAATQYSLQDNTKSYSSIRDTKQDAVGTTTLTFDSSGFNIQRTVRGTAFMSVGVEYSLGAMANTLSVQLFKYDGSTATAISTASVLTIGAETTQTIYSFEMPCTETLIAEKEQLRVVIILTIPAGGGGCWLSVGHDPANFDGENVTPSTADTITSTRINIPFKLE